MLIHESFFVHFFAKARNFASIDSIYFQLLLSTLSKHTQTVHESIREKVEFIQKWLSESMTKFMMFLIVVVHGHVFRTFALINHQLKVFLSDYTLVDGGLHSLFSFGMKLLPDQSKKNYSIPLPFWRWTPNHGANKITHEYVIICYSKWRIFQNISWEIAIDWASTTFMIQQITSDPSEIEYTHKQLITKLVWTLRWIARLNHGLYWIFSILPLRSTLTRSKCVLP